MAIVLEQYRAVTSATSLAYNNNNVAGNTLMVMVIDGTDTIATPTDTQGNTWTDCGVGAVRNNARYSWMKLYVAKNCKAGANTVSCSGVDGLQIIEWSGLDNSSLVDVFTSWIGNSGSGADNISVGPITTTVDGDLVLVCSICQGGPLSAGTGFTSPDGDHWGIWEYVVQGSKGDITGKVTNGTSTDNSAAMIVSFKAAASGGGGSKVPIIMKNMNQFNGGMI